MSRYLFTAAALFLVFANTKTHAQEDENADLVEERRAVMASLVADMMLVKEIDGQDVPVPLIDKPLTRYDDPSRSFQDGTLWGFGNTNERPQALITCYTTDASQGDWIHAMASLSDGPMKLTFENRAVWTPLKSELKFKVLEESGPPPESERARAIWMRQVSRRFTAHHFWDPNNQRFELRLLSTSAICYADPARGIVEGRVFLFARNINPEICLLIESVKEKDKTIGRYAIAKIGSAEFHVQLDGKEVWKSMRAPGVMGRPDDAYAMFISSRLIPSASPWQKLQATIKKATKETKK